MTGIRLDISTLSTDQTVTCNDGLLFKMSHFMQEFYIAALTLATGGRTRPPDNSWGCAITAITPIGGLEPTYDLNNAQDFVWCVGGHGPEVNTRIAEAVCTLRVTLREGINTADRRSNEVKVFYPVVPRQDGTFPLRDYPWQGAAYSRLNGLLIAGAVSGFDSDSFDGNANDLCARHLVGSLSNFITLHGGLSTNV